jgi:hypothetical protein
MVQVGVVAARASFATFTRVARIQVGAPFRKQEGCVGMPKEERDILELLKEQLDFVEKGGYGRSVRTPWQPKSPFQDSLVCLNFGYQDHPHACSDCELIDFVPSAQQTEAIPCHHIPLNETGETVAEVMSEDNQAKLEKKLKEWLRARIKEIEEERGNQAGA